MATTEKTRMVNGRVEDHAVSSAARVLAENGLTISSFIRNSIEYVAREGVVPPSGLPVREGRIDRSNLSAFIARIESAPMPGKKDHPELSGDELVERLLMERYGY